MIALRKTREFVPTHFQELRSLLQDTRNRTRNCRHRRQRNCYSSNVLLCAFSIGRPQSALVYSITEPRMQPISSRVGLVCGASRGLGAELAAVIGAVKSHLYLACRNPNEQILALKHSIEQAGGTAQIVQGDVGDFQWCSSTLSKIMHDHGRLDLLVLNACEPPRSSLIAVANNEQSADYLNKNLALIQAPLRTFLPAISDSCGTVVAYLPRSLMKLHQDLLTTSRSRWRWRRLYELLPARFRMRDLLSPVHPNCRPVGMTRPAELWSDSAKLCSGENH